MGRPPRKDFDHQPRKRNIPHVADHIGPIFPRQSDRVGSPRYAVLTHKEGWQLLLEHSDHYLRWVLRGAPGHGGPARPASDVAAASLERPGGMLEGKPALDSRAVELGYFENLRERGGETLAMSECLDEGKLELEFQGGEVMAGRWRLARSGSARSQDETWTFLRS
jgi:hypothetical protein